MVGSMGSMNSLGRFMGIDSTHGNKEDTNQTAESIPHDFNGSKLQQFHMQSMNPVLFSSNGP